MQQSIKASSMMYYAQLPYELSTENLRELSEGTPCVRMCVLPGSNYIKFRLTHPLPMFKTARSELKVLFKGNCKSVRNRQPTVDPRTRTPRESIQQYQEYYQLYDREREREREKETGIITITYSH